MRLKLPQIEIDASYPYKHDLMDRKAFGDALTNLIDQTNSELTISIDGQWGDGKTTFAKMWFSQLRQSGYRALYFDAFANDHGDDPFIPLSAALLEALTTEDEANEAKIRKLGKNVAKIGVRLLKIGGRIAVRAATAGTVGDSELAGFADIAEKAATEVSDELSDSLLRRLNEYHIDQSEIDVFRSLLSDVADSGEEGKPAVIILDELDRCRPTYALAALEKVKHFFSVEGLVFIFVLNTEQMCASVEQFYGRGIDARQYLHKFIDVECRLPSKDLGSRGPSHYRTYSQFLLNEHKFNAFGDISDLHEIVPPLAQAFNLSLRDIEKACRNIVLFYASIGERQLHISSVVALLAVLKVKDRKSYDEIAAGVLKSYEPVVERLKDDPNLDYIRYWFLTCLGHDAEVDDKHKSLIVRAQEIGRTVNLERTNFLHYHCAILDYFSL